MRFDASGGDISGQKKTEAARNSTRERHIAAFGGQNRAAGSRMDTMLRGEPVGCFRGVRKNICK